MKGLQLRLFDKIQFPFFVNFILMHANANACVSLCQPKEDTQKKKKQRKQLVDVTYCCEPQAITCIQYKLGWSVHTFVCYEYE